MSKIYIEVIEEGSLELFECDDLRLLCSLDLVSFKKKESFGSRRSAGGFPNASTVGVGDRVVNSVGAFDETCHEKTSVQQKVLAGLLAPTNT